MTLSDEILNKLAKNKDHPAHIEKLREIDLLFGNPSKSFRSIHVAGTNGKGSVTTKIAYGLSQIGYKTGLFTSPHITTFRERIQINGVMISDQALEALLLQVLAKTNELNYFELLTMVAFLYFQKEKVDFGVIETGLGGTLDATNIIHPELSVITTISYDHMKILGSTLEEIAENKGGIIKQGAPLVLGSRAVYDCILKKASECQSPVFILPPMSDWMEENTEIAKKALDIIHPDFPEMDLSIVPPCRFEKNVFQGIMTICDIAHNEDGLRKLFTRLKSEFPGKPLYVIFGMCRDKDVDASIKIIEEHAKAIYPYEIEDNQRLLSKKELGTLLKNKAKSLENWVEKEGILVITGSAYIMHHAKNYLSSCSTKLTKSRS